MPIRTALFRLVLIFSLFSLALPQSTRAQGQASAVLYEVDAEKFSLISGLMDVYDAQGQFIRGLNSGSVSMLEAGVTITPRLLREQEVPLQVVVAINSGPALATRDSNGISRYDKALDVLENWVASRPADSKDTFSLTWNGGIVSSRVSPLTWRNRLEIFDPQPRASTPSLAALSYALDAALDAPVPPGGKRAILLISSHLENQNIPALSDLTARARQAGIRIYVWVIDSRDFLVHPGSDALRQLATDTGGRWLDFTGTETITDPEEWVETLRWVYAFEYESAVRSSGTFSLSALISAGDQTLTTNAVSLDLVVLPPNPILLSPPDTITRQNIEDPFDLENSQPTRQALEMLVEFPDGHERSLVRSALYADDVLVQENTSAPFDQFNWDLRPYQVPNSQVQLRVEVTDSLGLSNSSASLPVVVATIPPPGGLFGLILRHQVAIVTTAVVLAGLVLLLAIFFGGRKTVNRIAEQRRARARQLDPVTQPVSAAGTVVKPQAANPFPWLRRKAPPPLAYLVRLTIDGQPAPGDPIPLSAPELTIGADPTQATNVLGDPSIAPLHARIQRTADDGFFLVDNRSVAGTWVNYELIPVDGRALAHGDVVNFGKLTYRFVLGKPPVPQKPKLTPIQQK